MEVIYNPYRYKQGIQANTASVMHGRFQHHSPTDTEGQMYKHLSSDTDTEYLWTECEMPPAHSSATWSSGGGAIWETVEALQPRG